jgi:hypothetical protein
MTFFPPTFDRFRSEWYGKHLVAMDEPSLFELAASGGSALRFLWLRTFHHPIAVRLHRSEGIVKLVALRLTGQGGYEPGTIDVRIERDVDEADWIRVEAALDAARFDDPAPEVGLGADGAQWIVERARGGEYRMLDRWSPDVAGPHGDFRHACETFLRLVGEGFVSEDIY